MRKIIIEIDNLTMTEATKLLNDIDIPWHSKDIRISNVPIAFLNRERKQCNHDIGLCYHPISPQKCHEKSKKAKTN